MLHLLTQARPFAGAALQGIARHHSKVLYLVNNVNHAIIIVVIIFPRFPLLDATDRRVKS